LECLLDQIPKTTVKQFHEVTHVAAPDGLLHSLTPVIYTECPRRNVPDFGRVFLMLKYTDITQNTYVQS